MSSLTNTIVKQSFLKLQSFLQDELKFFDKPEALVVLTTLALSLLGSLSDKYKNKLSSNNLKPINLDDLNELKNFVKSDKALNTILSTSDNSLSDDIVSSIILQCQLGTSPIDQISLDSQISDALNKETFNAQNFINIISQTSDIDIKTNNGFSSLSSKINSIYKETEVLLPFVYLTYYIIKLTIELISQNDYLSTYRVKFVQKNIRIFSGLIKNMSNQVPTSIKSTFDNMLQTLKNIDSIIIGLSLLTFIYIKNRRTLQDTSTTILKEDVASKNCIVLEDASTFDIITSSLTNVPTLNIITCPVTDDVIVPKEPFEEKAKNINCDNSTGQNVSFTEASSQDLSTSVIIENLTSKKFKINSNIGVNSIVSTSTSIATLDNLTIFSPVNGIIGSFDENSLIINDYSDDETNIITDNIQPLNDKYTELNNTTLFLKDFYINSLYPIMLTNTPIISDSSLFTSDTSTLLLYALRKGFSLEVKPKYDNAINSYNTLNDNYNNNIQTIAGADNVETLAKNEDLNGLKTQIDDLNNLFYKNLHNIGIKAINSVKKTIPFIREFTLIDYYIILSINLNIKKELNDIEKIFVNELNNIIKQRLAIDKFNPSNIISLINNLLKSIQNKSFIFLNFNNLLNNYNQTKKIKTVENIVNTLLKKNNNLTDVEKETIFSKILYLFNLYVSSSQFTQKYNGKKTNQLQQTINESNFFNNFFNNLWKRYNEIPKEINDIINKIDNVFQFKGYTTKIVNNIEYRYYPITEEDSKCIQPTDVPEDPYLTSKTKNGYDSKNYWLKYCSFATLASVANPGTGWATGFPPPIGPIPFPVVYIPIKPITTSYGFIVLGLSICGIWLFPWVLMTNLSSEYNTPLGNPTKFIKDQIKKLKKEINLDLKNTKENILKGYLDKSKSQIDFLSLQITSTQNDINKWRENKPSAIPKNAVEYNKWIEHNIVLKEKLTSLKIQKWNQEIKYKIIYNAYTIGTPVKTGDASDTTLNNIEQNETNLNNKLDNLIKLSEQASLTLAPLPITLKTESASFGITAKNPKPVINMSNNLNENINQTTLDNINNKFKLDNNKMSNTNYKNSLNDTIVNNNTYRKLINSSKYSIITKDSFPKFENLTPINLPWTKFLLTDWTAVGAKTYGFPGFPPFPV